MPDPKDLISPQGKPLLNKERKIIVIKTPRDVKLHPQMFSDISKLSGCAVISIPMDSEIIMGELAVKELLSIHSAIHAILEIPKTDFSEEEIKVIFSSLKFLCEKTQPGDDSNEVALLNKVKELVK